MAVRPWLVQVVPAAMTIPISRLYAIRADGFAGIWLFHTGFGTVCIYCCAIHGQPAQGVFDAYIYGVARTAFWKLSALCAGAGIAYLQFCGSERPLVALVFLGGEHPCSSQIGNMVTSHWELMDVIAAIKGAMLVFLLQKYFVRGMLAGSVKG